MANLFDNLPLEPVLCGVAELPADDDDAAAALLVDVVATADVLPESLFCCDRGIKLAFKLGWIANSVKSETN